MDIHYVHHALIQLISLDTNFQMAAGPGVLENKNMSQ